MSGKQVVFIRGNAGLAVRASSTIPGLVSPVTINERDYVDGSLISKVPVQLARQLGADLVIAVDVSRQPDEHAELDSTVEVMQQALAIMSQSMTTRDLQDADIIIRPDIGPMPFGDFEQKRQAIKAGKDAVDKASPDIKRVILEQQKNGTP
jgi:NTE family protein